MKVKIAAAVISLFIFAGVATQVSAEGTKKATHRKTRTVTGCLQRGEDAHEYNLAAKNGATWEMTSDNVNLNDHVGHTITVTGVVSNAKAHGMKEDAKAEMKEHGMEKHTAEHGHMTVTDLKMVSDSCQK